MVCAQAPGAPRPEAELAFSSFHVKWRLVPVKPQIFMKSLSFSRVLPLFSLGLCVAPLLSKNTSLLCPQSHCSSRTQQCSQLSFTSARKCLMQLHQFSSLRRTFGACCLLPQRKWLPFPPERPYHGLDKEHIGIQFWQNDSSLKIDVLLTRSLE